MFNILDSAQNIHSHHIIEASAGTGKTFTIENLVVRLLIEEESISLDKILVVTFTRAATRDLRDRIRSSLTAVKRQISSFIRQGEFDDRCPQYLSKSLQDGSPESLLKKVEYALSIFDQSNIDTIHGFCAKMLSQYALECGESLHGSDPNDPLRYKDTLLKAIGEFLRTELSPTRYTHEQLGLLLKKFKGDAEWLQEKLLKIVEKGMEIRAHNDLDLYVKQFNTAMNSLKKNFLLESAKIVEDFHAQVPYYNKIVDGKSKMVKREILDSVTRFASLFDKEEWNLADLDTIMTDGLIIVECFTEDNRAKKGPKTPPLLHYPDLTQRLATEIAPIVTKAGDPRIIFASVAKECQQYTQRVLSDNDVFTHQGILTRMRSAIESPSFADRIRNTFSAVIVDEFQDTDPVQWEIFSQLFLQKDALWKGHIYLVGDPKQSIYSFRQADIYTYLTAARELHNGSTVTLDTNFRSHKLLIDGLNILFNTMKSPFPLPKFPQGLPYKNVKAGRDITLPFSDAKPCLQFWLAHEDPSEAAARTFNDGEDAEEISDEKSSFETYFLIPALINELISLENQGISNKRCAVLVKDRKQANLVEDMLSAAGISVRKQRGAHLGETIALEHLKDILKGIHNYKNRSDLVKMLTTRLIGWTRADLLALDDPEGLDLITSLSSGLQETLLEKGFARFYRDFMNSAWKKDGPTVLTALLQQKECSSYFRNVQDVADMLSFTQSHQNLSYDGLIEFIEELQQTADDDDEHNKGYLDADDEGIMLMTTHVSKGLEFDVVFALGLSKRHNGKDELVPVSYVDENTGKTKHFLVPVVDDESSEYTLYQQELNAEKLRQLYVALTRAKFRVYVPVTFKPQQEEDNPPKKGKKNKPGNASPIDLMIESLAEKNEYSDSPEKIFCSFVDSHTELMSYQWIDGKQNNGIRIPKLGHTLKLPPKILLEHTPSIVQSFTSLTKQMNEHEYLDEAPPTIGAAPNDFDCEEKSPHTLPAGNQTGLLLHTIYENIRFCDTSDAKHFGDILPLINPYILGTPFEPWKLVVADIVYRSLKTPLEGKDVEFCLADVDPEKCYKEAPFMFACNKRVLGTGITAHEGYIKGVIDLFFEHQGKYYLLDWKSNWLGPTLEDYTPEEVQKAIKDNAYDIQAALYVEALEKYLRIVDPRPFQEIFGGSSTSSSEAQASSGAIHKG